MDVIELALRLSRASAVLSKAEVAQCQALCKAIKAFQEDVWERCMREAHEHALLFTYMSDATLTRFAVRFLAATSSGSKSRPRDD